MDDQQGEQNRSFSISIQGEDKTAELQGFAQFIGLNAVAPGRYSILLLLQLFGGFAARTQNPAKVIYEIRALEGLGGQSQTKPPTQFEKLPLRGLWHKHYMADGLSPMARNLLNGIRKDGLPWLEQTVREAEEAGEERFFTAEDVPKMAHDAVQGNWMRRAEAEELTGEWIIYAQHEGSNYYLCLGEHKSGDENLRAQIEALCFYEFPFLPTLLSIS